MSAICAVSRSVNVGKLEANTQFQLQCAGRILQEWKIVGDASRDVPVVTKRLNWDEGNGGVEGNGAFECNGAAASRQCQQETASLNGEGSIRARASEREGTKNPWDPCCRPPEREVGWLGSLCHWAATGPVFPFGGAFLGHSGALLTTWGWSRSRRDWFALRARTDAGENLPSSSPCPSYIFTLACRPSSVCKCSQARFFVLSPATKTT